MPTPRQAKRRRVCLRVSQTAYDRLNERAELEGLSRTRVLERTIEIVIPKRSHHVAGDRRHHWPEPTGNTRRRRASRGTRTITLEIGQTAYRKLEAEADATGESQSRVIDRLLRTHQWQTQEERERNQRYLDEGRRLNDSYRDGTWTPPPPPTPERMEECRQEMERIIQAREDGWNRMVSQVRESRMQREEEG